MRRQRAEADRALGYLLLATLVGVVALAGYGGYVLYPRFDLPAVTGLSLLALAAAAGIASFFSPCSFPLLVTLLARETGARPGQTQPSMDRALRFGLALAVGAGLFLTLLGVAIALGGAALFAGVTFTSTAGIILRSVVGALLILLGLIQLGLLPASFRAIDHLVLPLTRSQAQLRRDRPLLGFGVLGFGYLLAGFG